MVHKDLLNPQYLEWRAFLAQSSKWDSARMEQYQLVKLRHVLEYAYRYTPGYRESFDRCGVEPSRLTTLDDIRRFPFITRQMLHNDVESFSVKVPGRYRKLTGGSTGEPVSLYATPEIFAKELASKAHQYCRIGWREGDRELVLRQPHTEDIIKFWPEYNQLRCSVFHLTDENMQKYLDAALKFKPQWLRCHPSAGFVFAKFLNETGQKLTGLQGVLCASEQLLEHQEDYLNQAFYATVFSHYGHVEMAALAGYCKDTSIYHVMPQYGYVELLDESDESVQAGETGQIVATSFINTATPFIRYKTGDYATLLHPTQCSACGQPYQTWSQVQGRAQDFFVSRSNRLVSLLALNIRSELYDYISQVQFVQREPGLVEFHYVPKTWPQGATKPPLGSNALFDIKNDLSIRLGEGFTLTLKAVEEIPLTEQGKHIYLAQEECDV